MSEILTGSAWVGTLNLGTCEEARASSDLNDIGKLLIMRNSAFRVNECEPKANGY